MICPKCGKENIDDWPGGLCQDCWEEECDETWWGMVCRKE